MQIVDPADRTTLLLTRVYQPLAIITARACAHHFIRGRVKGVDANGNTFTWEDDDYMADVKDQPVMRSAHRVHKIPTIVICTSTFVKRGSKRDPFVSTRTIYRLYKGVCQYCLEKIPYSQATKDHVVPKSVGGTNHDYNIVLACKRCNGLKDNKFPYRNVQGEVVRARPVDHLTLQLSNMTSIREEWKPFLYRT